jgi:hypothetical protein
MMKQVNKVIKSQKGIALSIVLVLLALGGLVMTPLLLHLYTGVSSEQIYRDRMELNYAVDAGVEDGIWKADNDAVPLDLYDYTTVYSYSLPTTLNGKDVNVDIKQIWLLDGLESDINGTTPATPPMYITGGVVNSEGDFEIRLSYDTPEVELPVDSVAVWLPPDFEYVNNSSSIITEENPTQTTWNGGTVLRWDLDPAVNFDDLPLEIAEDPEEGGMQPAIELPSVRLLAFKVDPEGELARGSYCWFRTTDPNNYLCWDTNITIYQINATATDNVTGSSMSAQGYSYVSKGFDTGWLDMGETLMSGDYRAIGNTNMQDLNEDRRRETVLDESSAAISNIPSDASVVYAFLYWSGWKDYSGSMEPDKQVLFRIESAPDYIRPNAAGNYTECDPVGAVNNYQCTDEVVSDEDTTYVQTGTMPEVLRPNGSGTYTQCSSQPYGSNWECVDEETADDGSTYVYTNNYDTERDTYNLQDHTSGSGTINSVTVHIRSRSSDWWNDMGFETMIRTHGENHYGDYTEVGSSWTDLSTTYDTNPATDQPWTWSEIDALEAGVRQEDNGWWGDAQTTQVYVSVDYGVPESLSTVLRPNATGDETGIPYQYPDTGAHWEKVDEATADDSSTYVKTEGTPITNWYDQSWLYRRKITIDHTKVENVANPSTTYANFPVLVYATGLSNVKPGGADIRFTASDGTTLLPREIESYSSGTLYAWVKVTLTKDSSDATDDEIYMYYGNAAATEPAPDSTYGSENVWDSNFAMVQHMVGASYTDLDDSTSNDCDVSAQDSDPAYGATGKIADAVTLDGNDAVEVSDPGTYPLDLDTAVTISAWINPSSISDWNRIAAKSHTADVDPWTMYGLLFDSNDHLRIEITDGGTQYGYNGGTTVSTGVWQYAVMSYDGSTLRLYYNGSQQGSGSSHSGDLDTNDQVFSIGKSGYESDYFTGSLDEIRVSEIARNARWIATEYNNQNDPANFCILESEQSSSTMDYERDLYHIANHTTESGSIGRVTAYFRFSGDQSGGQDYTGYARAAIKTHGVVYTGNEESQTGQSFITRSYEWANNPYTGSPWTWDEIDALQAGIELKGVLGTYGYCTQVYVEVQYGPVDNEDMDTYQLSDLEELRGTVESIIVYTETKGTTSPDTHSAQTVIRTHDTVYYGDNTTLPTSYDTLSTTYNTNPFTSSAWTLAEINALEAGVKHYDNGSGCVCTTQVYIGVIYDIVVEETITAEKWWLMENQAPDYAYSCFKDVTSIVSSATDTGNALYTVGDVYGSTGSELSYAGWSLILIYSSPSEMGTQFYLYDDLTFAGTNAYGTFLVEGFVAPGDAQATLTSFVGEGDDWYDYDYLQFNGSYLSDEINPENDVWNGKSSGLAGEQIDGIDIDTFDVSAPIINPGDSSANLTYTTQQDNFNLIYHILAFRSDQGILTPSGTGVFSWD